MPQRGGPREGICHPPHRALKGIYAIGNTRREALVVEKLTRFKGGAVPFIS